LIVFVFVHEFAHFNTRAFGEGFHKSLSWRARCGMVIAKTVLFLNEEVAFGNIHSVLSKTQQK